MSRYVGMFVLLLGTMLLVKFASDFLYTRAVAMQTGEADEPARTSRFFPALFCTTLGNFWM